MNRRTTLLDWEERRALAYQFKEFNDVNLPIVYNSLSGDELVDQVFSFFVSGSQLIYPAKSYFVALIYAALLQQLVAMEVLSVPQLYANGSKYIDDSSHTVLADVLDLENLLPDDKYFVPFHKDPYVYDKVWGGMYSAIVCTGKGILFGGQIVYSFPSASSTVGYFFDEFLIDEKTRERIRKIIEYTREQCEDTYKVLGVEL